MANADTDVTIRQVHEAQIAALTAQFPAFKTVEAYRQDESERISTPALLLEMIEIEPTDEISSGGNGKMPAYLRFEGRIIMQVRSKTAAMEARIAAGALLTWLYQRRIPGLKTDPVVVIGAEPDDFAPAHGGFMAWRVEWAVPVLLGEDAWKSDGVVTEALYSFAPDIGAANEHKYRPISSGPESAP